MARLCEGTACGKQVGLPDEPCESFTDPRGIEHDYCRACWELPVPCVACGGGVRRNDPRVIQALLADETLVFAHARCRDAAALAYFTLVRGAAAPPLPPPAEKKPHPALNGRT